MSYRSWVRPSAYFNELVPSEIALKLIDTLSFNVDAVMLMVRSGSHNHNPYHNTLHELQHVYWSYSCFMNSRNSASYHKLASVLSAKNQNDRYACCTLVMASLFHDHNHSGGKHSDMVNIERAIKFARTYLDDAYPEVDRLIRVTEFLNGTFPHPPTDLLEECMRDADLMSIYSREGRRLLWGLLEEISGKRLENMTDNELSNALKRNRDFLKNAEMYTEFGRVMKNEHLDAALIDFENATTSQFRYRKDVAREEDE
jgi:hypothetical protein